jgi:hypothetical protein
MARSRIRKNAGSDIQTRIIPNAATNLEQSQPRLRQNYMADPNIC